MGSLNDKLKKVNLPRSKPRAGPVWKGPEQDGITFSLLSRFLACRERFRLLAVEGLKPADHFNHRMEFGHCWHTCEEATQTYSSKYLKSETWEGRLTSYAAELAEHYPFDREKVETCYQTVRVMFHVYLDYWSQHPDVLKGNPLLREQVFDVPYRLPSGRTVRLRGKWDGADLVGKGKRASVWLVENKTKSEVDEQKIARQLSFDLQTMTYLVALSEKPSCDLHRAGYYRHGGGVAVGNTTRSGEAPAGEYPIQGVRYNVVRRPRQYQGKKESAADFYDRLRGIVASSPGEFFHRWNVNVSLADVASFRRRCLDPILEQLCDWWDFVSFCARNRSNPFDQDFVPAVHWQHPFGVYNPLDEGGSSDLDEYLATGSEFGLQRTDNLYPELT